MDVSKGLIFTDLVAKGLSIQTSSVKSRYRLSPRLVIPGELSESKTNLILSSPHKGLNKPFVGSMDALYPVRKSESLCDVKLSTKNPDFARFNPAESRTSKLSVASSSIFNDVSSSRLVKRFSSLSISFIVYLR